MWSEQIKQREFPDYVDIQENEQVQNSLQSQNKSENQNQLPPPNPILDHRYGDEGIKTALNVVFSPLPEFSVNNGEEKLGARHKIFKTNQKNFQDDKNQGDNEEYAIEDINDDSIYSHYFNLKAPQVYRKFDNSQCNSIPFTKKKYFAGYFCNINDIITDQSGKLLVEQNKLNQSNNNLLRINMESQNDDIIEDSMNQEQLSTSISQHNSPKNNLTIKSINRYTNQKNSPKVGNLKFDSNFESGNLFAAFKIGEKEYDLVLQNDINSKGNTQWFFFSVQNMAKNQTVRFNIVNFLKNDSLFNYGMKPVVFSSIENEENRNSWERACYSITYEKSNILREGSSSRYYYKLSFSYQFKHQNDVVYFAQCYPYTYSDLQKFITGLFNSPERKCFLSKKLLCQTIAKNRCEILTITSSSYFTNQNQQNINETQSSLQDVLSPSKHQLEFKDKKQIVFLTARQHPGETPASYMMQGVIEFLTDPNNSESQFLRDHFIFKIVPMLNPDGVIHGNYRCSLSGVDLNRQWLNPSKEFHPTIYYTKSAILKYCQERKCRFLCDFHGHSKKMNSFFYGNPFQDDPYLPKIIPIECQNINKAIQFKSCTFRLSEDKESTFRQALLEDLPYNPYIYTFESSFYGSQSQNQRTPFNIEDFKNLGRDVMRGFYFSVKEEIEEELYQFNSQQDQNYKSLSQFTESENLKEQVVKANKSQDYKMLIQTLIDNQEVSNEADNGSDSNPSEDELSKKELNSLNSQNTSKKTKKKQCIQSLAQKSVELRQSSKETPKKLQRSRIEERNSFNISSTPEIITVRTSKKISELFQDQAVQTENNFDFSKLQRFQNQREFFSSLRNSNMYAQSTEDNFYGYELSENQSQKEKNQQNQFSNKLICQALQGSSKNLNETFSSNSIQRPRTSNGSSESVQIGKRNTSVSLKPKDTLMSQETKSNLLNNSVNLSDNSKIYKKKGESFQSTSTRFYCNSIKNSTNNNPFKIQSINISQQQQNQLMASIDFNSNKLICNGLFVSGQKYQGDNKTQKIINHNDSDLNISLSKIIGKDKRNKEVQTFISIPIIQKQITKVQSSITQNPQPNNQIQQERTPQSNTNQIKLNSNQQNQLYLNSYNQNHLNVVSPKKKQYLLYISKKEQNSKTIQIKSPLQNDQQSESNQQNSLFQDINQRIARESIHSPIVKLFKNINSAIQQNTQSKEQNDVSFSQSINQIKQESKQINNDNKSYNVQQINQTQIKNNNQRSNSVNTTNMTSKGKNQSQVKQVIKLNNITQLQSICYVNNLQMNLQIKQCSPFQSPVKKNRNIITTPSQRSRRNIKPFSTEPNSQSSFQF